MPSWVVPTTHWRPVREVEDVLGHLNAEGTLLVTWPPAPFEHTPTHCFQLEDDYWIWQPEVGGVQFTATAPDLVLHPIRGTDLAWFEQLVTRSWLPAIYPIWQRQVLHSSAVAATVSGDVIAFTGSGGAGKSTTAYGLARRPGWTLVADDTLAFSTDTQSPQISLTLHPLRRAARLRAETAVHFGKPHATEEPFDWPAIPLRLRVVYVLDGSLEPASDTQVTGLSVAEAYPLLLGQAHAMTLEQPEHNQRLMRDYLALAASVTLFRLSYARGFEHLDSVLKQIERHAAAQGVRLAACGAGV
jgi:hypothetical protein